MSEFARLSIPARFHLLINVKVYGAIKYHSCSLAQFAIRERAAVERVTSTSSSLKFMFGIRRAGRWKGKIFKDKANNIEW